MLYKNFIHYKQQNHLDTTNYFIILFNFLFNKNKIYLIQNLEINLYEINKNFIYLYYQIIITLYFLNNFFKIFKTKALNLKTFKFNILNSCFVYKKTQLHYQIQNFQLIYKIKTIYNCIFLNFLQNKLINFLLFYNLKKLTWKLKNN